MLKEEMRAIIAGQVQGVGFRAITKRMAARIGLTGYAKNLSNGSVEICAQGTRMQCEELIAQLKAHFGQGSIRHIDLSYSPIQKPYLEFFII